MKTWPKGYEFNLPLRDALDVPTQAAGCKGARRGLYRQGLDDAYLRAQALLETFRTRETDTRHKAINTAPALMLRSEVPAVNAVRGLIWLTALLPAAPRIETDQQRQMLYYLEGGGGRAES